MFVGFVCFICCLTLVSLFASLFHCLLVCLRQAWYFFDWQLHTAGCGNAAQLADVVRDPDDWIRCKAETAILFSDQIPVWLKTEAAKVLVPVNAVKHNKAAAKQRQQLRKRLAEQEAAARLADAGGDAVGSDADEQALAATEDKLAGLQDCVIVGLIVWYIVCLLVCFMCCLVGLFVCLFHWLFGCWLFVSFLVEFVLIVY